MSKDKTTTDEESLHTRGKQSTVYDYQVVAHKESPRIGVYHIKHEDQDVDPDQRSLLEFNIARLNEHHGGMYFHSFRKNLPKSTWDDDSYSNCTSDIDVSEQLDNISVKSCFENSQSYKATPSCSNGEHMASPRVGFFYSMHLEADDEQSRRGHRSHIHDNQRVVNHLIHPPQLNYFWAKKRQKEGGSISSQNSVLSTGCEQLPSCYRRDGQCETRLKRKPIIPYVLPSTPKDVCCSQNRRLNKTGTKKQTTTGKPQSNKLTRLKKLEGLNVKDSSLVTPESSDGIGPQPALYYEEDRRIKYGCFGVWRNVVLKHFRKMMLSKTKCLKRQSQRVIQEFQCPSEHVWVFQKQ